MHITFDRVKRIRDLAGGLQRWSERYIVVRVAKRAVTGFTQNDGTHYAAGIAYFTLLSLFQLAVLGVVVLSFFFGEGSARELVVGQLSRFTPMAPDTADQIIGNVLESRGGVSLLALPFLLLGAFGIFAALQRGVNRAFGVEEPHGMLRQQLTNFLLVGALGLLLLASLLVGLLVRVLRLILEATALPGGELAAQALGLAVPFAVSAAALLLIYRVVPNRWVTVRAALPGALIAAAAWTILQATFSIYATQIADYRSAFGPISSAISLIVFLYFSSAIVLAGATLTRSILDELGDPPQSGAP